MGRRREADEAAAIQSPKSPKPEADHDEQGEKAQHDDAEEPYSKANCLFLLEHFINHIGLLTLVAGRFP